MPVYINSRGGFVEQRGNFVLGEMLLIRDELFIRDDSSTFPKRLHKFEEHEEHKMQELPCHQGCGVEWRTKHGGGAKEESDEDRGEHL